jgi:lipoprotein-releasing system ATP-binding protein
MENINLLELQEVGRSYLSPEGSAVPVLEGISLEVRSGDSLAITGPSGSGKSTLLNLIGALDRPTTGRICLEGSDLSLKSDAELAGLRNREIGFVFQQHHLLPQCTALENVLIPTLPRVPAVPQATASSVPSGNRTRSREEARKQGCRLLERVGLGARLDYRPGQLSGGERQRVALVRALINQPRLLLADEPTGALDQASARQLADLLLELNREERVTLILVTHALDLAGRMQRQYALRQGRLVG